MKKWMIAFSIVLVFCVGLTSVVSAQSEEPPPPENPLGWRARLIAWRYPGAFEVYGQALADELGLTLEEMTESLKNGETPLQIALSLGFSEEEFQDLRIRVRDDLIEEALAEGKISEEQAEVIRQRWEKGIKRSDLVRYFRQQVRERLAEALGLSPDALQERLENGETMLEIALSQGYNEEDFQAMVAELQEEVIDQALEENILTEEQAEKLKALLGDRSGFFPSIRRRLQHFPEKRFLYPRLAEALGLDWQDIQDRLVAGETWLEIIKDLGVHKEDLRDAMDELGGDIIKKAQESRLISPKRGEAILEGGILRPFRWLHQQLQTIQRFRWKMR